MMPDHPRRAVTLMLLTAIYVFNFMDRQILGVLAEPIKHELDLSDAQLGLLTGFFFALFYTGFGVPVAWLADRTRRTWVIAGACTAWSFFSAACGLASGFAFMAAARVGVAVGEAGGVPPSYALISDLYVSSKRARAIAIYSLGVPVGVGIGTAVGGLIAAAFGWRAAFFVVAAPGPLLALALLALAREPARVSRENQHAMVPLTRSIALFIGSPPLILAAIAGGLGAFTCYGLMAWLSAYFIRVFGMSLGQIGSWLSIALALGLGAGLWLSGAFADRFGTRDPRRYAIVPAVGLALGGATLSLATSAHNAFVALPLFSLTLAFSVSYLAPLVALVQHLSTSDQRSTASALLLLFINLIGLGCGPLAIGLVSDWTVAASGSNSLRVAFYALVPMFIAASIACSFAARALRIRVTNKINELSESAHKLSNNRQIYGAGC